MTFLGFVLAVVIIGVIFYAWYAYVNRSRDNAAQVNRPGNIGANRAATNMETGTIGELLGTQETARQQQAGRYMEETGMIGDLPSQADIDAANSVGANVEAVQQALHTAVDKAATSNDQDSSAIAFGLLDNKQALAQANRQVFQTEFGRMGSTEDQDLAKVIHQAFHDGIGGGNQQANASTQQGGQDLTSAIHQAFQEEIGDIGGNQRANASNQQGGQGQNLTSAIHQAFQEEIGDIGGQGQTGNASNQQARGGQQGGNADDLTEAIHQAFRNEFYSMNEGKNKKKQR